MSQEPYDTEILTTESVERKGVPKSQQLDRASGRASLISVRHPSSYSLPGEL